jgi:hypothetical protein
LIEALSANGRAGYTELAARTGLSPLTARRRVEALIRGRVVRLATELDLALLGCHAEALHWLTDNRSSVTEPDSIGILITGPNDAQVSVVQFRGGWADVDFMAAVDDAGVLPASDIDSARAFGDLLDRCVTRTFGSKDSGR